MFDLLIKNGAIIDGTVKDAFCADIAIKDGKIVDYRSKTASKNLTISDINLLFNEYDVYGE